MHALISEHFSPAFGNTGSGDSAVITVPGTRLAYTTDSYVVSPLFFPGGNIGDLAVCGTVNDLAVAGAEPLYLTAGFIIEEGLPLDELRKIVATMADQARTSGVRIVAGDTKVVNKGKADGVFINTSGVGLLRDGVDICPKRIQPGDAVILSGEIGNHGIAVLAERNNLTFDPQVLSDTRPLNGLVKAMQSTGADIRFMRDPTRGGLATTLKEAALESGLCICISEKDIIVPRPVRGACELLGLDPLYIANEGVLIAVTRQEHAAELVSAMRKHPFGAAAAVIGTVVASPAGTVLLETGIGGRRVIDMLQGEMLPRIC